ncbi:hypothetical protein BC629DRAFT_1539342, partial [Irpex lacteus]
MALPQAVNYLQSANILVKFTVTHQWLGRAAAPDTKKDNYYADIDEIQVLKALRPTPTGTSPRKRVRENTAQDSDGLSHKQKRTRTKN